jgi:hypothetical protein
MEYFFNQQLPEYISKLKNKTLTNEEFFKEFKVVFDVELLKWAADGEFKFLSTFCTLERAKPEDVVEKMMTIEFSQTSRGITIHKEQHNRSEVKIGLGLLFYLDQLSTWEGQQELALYFCKLIRTTLSWIENKMAMKLQSVPEDQATHCIMEIPFFGDQSPPKQDENATGPIPIFIHQYAENRPLIKKFVRFTETDAKLKACLGQTKVWLDSDALCFSCEVFV